MRLCHNLSETFPLGNQGACSPPVTLAEALRTGHRKSIIAINWPPENYGTAQGAVVRRVSDFRAYQGLILKSGRLSRLGAQIAWVFQRRRVAALLWPRLIENMDKFSDLKPRLVLTGITKRYPSVVANEDVSLRVRPGEIHAVLGENGAGKSTLMKIIYGVTKPDAGTIMWNGQYETIVAPSQARRMGIGMVFQHFSLFETLTVWENIALALDEPVPTARLAAQITEVSEKYGLPIDPYRLVHSMSVGERQRVEIVRCLLQEPKLLIMDEPTSVLTPQAVLILFKTLRRLASEGCSILYISHKLDEIRALCDTATVLRGGKVSGEAIPRNETNEKSRTVDDRRRTGGMPSHSPRGEGSTARCSAFVAAVARSVRDIAQGHQPTGTKWRDTRDSRRFRKRSKGVDDGAVGRAAEYQRLHDQAVRTTCWGA